MSPQSSGRYEHLANAVQRQLDAQAVVLIVLAGSRGTGVNIAANGQGFGPELAELLRQLADSMDEHGATGWWGRARHATRILLGLR